MLYEARMRRIRQRYVRVRQARAAVKAEGAKFVAEVEAAKVEDGIEYSSIAKELGISRQALGQARDKVKGKGGRTAG